MIGPHLNQFAECLTRDTQQTNIRRVFFLAFDESNTWQKSNKDGCLTAQIGLSSAITLDKTGPLPSTNS